MPNFCLVPSIIARSPCYSAMKALGNHCAPGRWPVSAIVFFLRALWAMICLPIAYVAEDRIVAFRIYQAVIGIPAAMMQRQNPRSLLLRLHRAARRQEIINQINLPDYQELQRRKWQRSYAYWTIVRRVILWMAISCAADCTISELRGISPGAANLFVWQAKEVVGLIDGFWRWVEGAFS